MSNASFTGKANVKTTDPLAVAVADKTKVVAFVIDAIVVPTEIPVPLTAIPTTSEDVSAVVIVVVLLVVQVSCLERLCPPVYVMLTVVPEDVNVPGEFKNPAP